MLSGPGTRPTSSMGDWTPIPRQPSRRCYRLLTREMSGGRGGVADSGSERQNMGLSVFEGTLSVVVVKGSQILTTLEALPSKKRQPHVIQDICFSGAPLFGAPRLTRGVLSPMFLRYPLGLCTNMAQRLNLSTQAHVSAKTDASLYRAPEKIHFAQLKHVAFSTPK